MDFEERLEKKLVDIALVDIAQDAPQTVILAADEASILAADEASLYLQASLTRVWAPVGQTPVIRVAASQTPVIRVAASQTPVIRVAANRDNTHFYGALNLATGEQVTLRSDLMNSQVSALFLNRLLDAYPDRAYPDRPILLLWDRAPWHKGEAIRSVLSANPRLCVLWFPAVVSSGLPGAKSAGTCLEGDQRSGQPQPWVCETASRCLRGASEHDAVPLFTFGQAWLPSVM